MLALTNVIVFLADSRADAQCPTCFAQMQSRTLWTVYQKVTFFALPRHLFKSLHKSKLLSHLVAVYVSE